MNYSFEREIFFSNYAYLYIFITFFPLRILIGKNKNKKNTIMHYTFSLQFCWYHFKIEANKEIFFMIVVFELLDLLQMVGNEALSKYILPIINDLLLTIWYASPHRIHVVFDALEILVSTWMRLAFSLGRHIISMENRHQLVWDYLLVVSNLIIIYSRIYNAI